MLVEKTPMNRLYPHELSGVNNQGIPSAGHPNSSIAPYYT
jgi:hypothetical protein